MNTSPRNRIVGHVTVPARELVPHPLNFRRHPKAQRAALAASYAEVGFARSLLGYRREDGRIQLIDGHLRAEFDPDREVTVELLDVNEDEARKLLLTIDPLAALAETDAEIASQLAAATRAESEVLEALWQSLSEASQTCTEPWETEEKGRRPPGKDTEQYLVLVDCANEREQVALLRRFQSEGLKCKALMS
jgi:hypothetical protein